MFNISFGYPGTDSCSKCDSFQAELQLINNKILEFPMDAGLYKQKSEAEANRELHQRKAENFYYRKKIAKT